MSTFLLAFVPLLVAIGFMIRMRAERYARVRAEQRCAELEAQFAAGEPPDELYRVLAHELRSPLGAILGYSELLGEGTLGPLDERALEATGRLSAAAGQLARLIDGIDSLGGDGRSTDPHVQDTSAQALITEAIELLRFDAEARGVSLAAAPGDLQLRTRRGDARRALVLALGAAIKASAGRSVQVRAVEESGPAICIAGTGLDVVADAPQRRPLVSARTYTGAGLRLTFADAAAACADGSVQLKERADGVVIELQLPRLSD